MTMKRTTRRNPELRATDLLAELGIDTSRKIDTEEIARQLGADVRAVALADGLSGLLVRDGGRSIISYSVTDIEPRQRFTIAHEIGHLLMHPGRPYIAETTKLVNVSKREVSRNYADAREEREANQFAAALLMPGAAIIEHWDALSNKVDNAESLASQLAKKYGVSKSAMKYRANNLGLYQFVDESE